MRYLLLLTLYLTLAAAWFWRLQPVELPPEDPQRGPRLERLARYLSKAPPSTVQGILFSIAPLPDERIALMDAWLKRRPLQQLRELTVQETPLLKDSGTLRQALLLGWLGQDPQPFHHEAHFMIAASGDRLDDQLRLYALECIARQALSEQQTEAALPILDRATTLPNANWGTFKTYITTARTLDQPKLALRAVNEWMRRQDAKKTPGKNEEAREIQVALMLQLNRGDDALEAQLDLLKAAPAHGPLPADALDHAILCARSSSLCAKIIPYLERQLTTYPEHALEPIALLNKADSDPTYVHWLREYAAIADKELPAARAFEACLRLAALGERGAYSRFCALADTAEAKAQAEKLLHQALAKLELRPAVLDLAQTDSLARHSISEALRAAPNDRDLHFAATLAEAAAKPGSAATLWQTYLHHFPADAPAQRRLIQAHLHARQPELALRIFDTITPENLTPADQHQREIIRQL